MKKLLICIGIVGLLWIISFPSISITSDTWTSSSNVTYTQIDAIARKLMGVMFIVTLIVGYRQFKLVK